MCHIFLSIVQYMMLLPCLVNYFRGLPGYLTVVLLKYALVAIVVLLLLCIGTMVLEQNYYIIFGHLYLYKDTCLRQTLHLMLQLGSVRNIANVFSIMSDMYHKNVMVLNFFMNFLTTPPEPVLDGFY